MGIGSSRGGAAGSAGAARGLKRDRASEGVPSVEDEVARVTDAENWFLSRSKKPGLSGARAAL
jgi:hypothetical protein